jgi:hypothetical protein
VVPDTQPQAPVVEESKTRDDSLARILADVGLNPAEVIAPRNERRAAAQVPQINRIPEVHGAPAQSRSTVQDQIRSNFERINNMTD